MLTDTRRYPKYDLPTAVTFLFAGLGLGWMAALLFAPRNESSAPPSRGVSARHSIADATFFG
jgi:hypothetical protein